MILKCQGPFQAKRKKSNWVSGLCKLLKRVHGHPQTQGTGLKYHGGWIHYISESGLRDSNFKIEACRIIMLQHMPAIICFLVHSELPQHNRVIHQCIKHAETGSVNYAWRIILLWCSAGWVCLCSVHWKAALTARDDWVLVCGIYGVWCCLKAYSTVIWR